MKLMLTYFSRMRNDLAIVSAVLRDVSICVSLSCLTPFDPFETLPVVVVVPEEVVQP